jgi:hypothetical protein
LGREAPLTTANTAKLDGPAMSADLARPLPPGAEQSAAGDAPLAPSAEPTRKRSLFQRFEAYVSKLSTRNNFWHKVCSLIWLPYAFRSGISMKRLDSRRFRAVLPFKRVNRNWYNAMAGAALLGNSEVAAGLFLFSEIGEAYIVVCKEMTYRFLRPCLGPAVYEIVNTEDLQQKVAAGGEFNIRIDMEIRQQLMKQKGKELRVGRCEITFHCTPKTMVEERKARRDKRLDA